MTTARVIVTVTPRWETRQMDGRVRVTVAIRCEHLTDAECERVRRAFRLWRATAQRKDMAGLCDKIFAALEGGADVLEVSGDRDFTARD